jgi:hypothetical protein
MDGWPKEDICIPDPLAMGAPFGILKEQEKPCPDDYATEIHLQEGGTCGCSCESSGGCSQEMQLYGEENCSDTGEPIVIGEGICAGPANLSVARAVGISAAAATCEPKSNPSDGKLMKLCAFSGSP